MRVLLDTNILIHRETAYVVKENIGVLFHWLDRLGHDKCVHPVSIEEIENYADERVRRSFLAKLRSYHVLRTPAPLHPEVRALSQEVDRSRNDLNDTTLVNEVFVDRVDILISEDRGVASKAAHLGIGEKVYTIDEFLERVTAENPDLADYEVLSIRKEPFSSVNLADPFFDSFREDYPGFERWFLRKSDAEAYVCREEGRIVAFLYLKVEDEREPYHDINPRFGPKRRLKIGTMKVELNGYKIGERFLKIIFDNAVRQRVEEIYVTVFPRTIEQQRLIELLSDYGFKYHGDKVNPYGDEEVHVRDLSPTYCSSDPKQTFPYVSRSARAFIVPIYPDYHTELLPDSILRTESPTDFVEHGSHRNAIRKVYVSRSIFRALEPGDVIVFYRTGGHYKGVVTTLGLVDRVHTRIENEEQFIRLCRKRSVFTDEQLREHWNYNSRYRPFIVEFLYAYSFPTRPNLAALRKHGVLRDAPRGFEPLTPDQLSAILSLSKTDAGIIVD